MLDIALIRDHPDEVRAALVMRHMDTSVVDAAQALDSRRRALLVQADTLKSERNVVSKQISQIKDPAERQTKIGAMRQVGDQIAVLDEQVRQVEADLHALVSSIPNIPDPSTPPGADDSENVVLRTVGEPKSLGFTPKPHWELGTALGVIDFERGTKITGSRFYVLSGAGARLQRALIAWMLDLHTRQGYTEKYLPFMVKADTLFASGQLPKFADNLYHDVEEDFWMVPTAEVPLTSLHRDEILDADTLPLRYTAYTPCFRREKMSAGRDVRGIKRGHQFDKVEMYIFCEPENSPAELDKMVTDAEQTCADLGLTYRIKRLRRRPGFWRTHHLRPGSLGAGLRRMVGGFFCLQRLGFSSPPCRHPLPRCRRETPPGAYPQRLRVGLAAHLDRSDGKLSTARWFHCCT